MEISKVPHGNNDVFTIQADDDEIRKLRGVMDQMHASDMSAYWRAHIPIMSYHHDKGNESYDHAFTEAYRLVYELGDEKTKQHIVEMGILGNAPM